MQSETRMNTDRHTPPEMQLLSKNINARTVKARMLLAVAISVAGAAATIIRISTYSFFGPDQYLIQALPYLLIIVLAITCRRSVLSANISLVGSLAMSACGVL